MISHPHRCIFVHIPKTAGNSINRVFGVGWEDHKDLQRYRDELSPELFQKYFKFAVVRNPWDRLLSDYNYQRKKSRAKDSKLFVFTEGGSRRNFAEWVEVALTHPEQYNAERWGGAVSPTIHRWSPQIDWISVDGRPQVDFIARLERLPQDFRAICHRLDIPAVRLPHRNRRLHWHYSHYYERETRHLVASYYARDVEYFGYEFEQSALRFWSFGADVQRSAAARSNAPAAPSIAKIPATAKRPATMGHSPSQRTYAILIAAFAMFIGAWTAPLSVKSSDHAASSASVGTAVQETFGRVLVQSGNSPAGSTPLSSVAQIRRLSRTTPGMHLNAELLLPASLAFAPLLEIETPTQRLPSASWPAATPESRPARGLRSWFNRHERDS